MVGRGWRSPTPLCRCGDCHSRLPGRAGGGEEMVEPLWLVGLQRDMARSIAQPNRLQPHSFHNTLIIQLHLLHFYFPPHGAERSRACATICYANLRKAPQLNRWPDGPNYPRFVFFGFRRSRRPDRSTSCNRRRVGGRGLITKRDCDPDEPRFPEIPQLTRRSVF